MGSMFSKKPEENDVPQTPLYVVPQQGQQGGKKRRKSKRFVSPKRKSRRKQRT